MVDHVDGAAELAEAQAEYDRAMLAGASISAPRRSRLACRLAAARSDYRAAVHGYATRRAEAGALADALPGGKKASAP